MKKLFTIALVLNIFSMLINDNYCFSLSSINAPYNLTDEKDSFSKHLAKLPVSEKVKRHLINFSPSNSESIFLQDDFVIRRKVDFNNHPIGKYTDAQWKSDWKMGNLYQPNTTEIQSVDGERVLANYYPKGTWGRRGGLNQWGDFRDSPNDIEELYWTYRIKVDKDFDWGISGKQPGVSMGTVSTVAVGGAGPNLGNKGGSMRLAWGRGGTLQLYVYHHSMPGKYGDNMGLGQFAKMTNGQWHEITVRVVANEINKANGIMQVWLDGILVASVQDIEMRSAKSPKFIQGISMGTFMGGSGPQYATSRNQYMWMDDFYFWQYSKEFLKNNPSVARGLKLHPASHKLYTPLSTKVEEEANRAPTVSINGPAANAQLKQGDNISVTANAACSDGRITKVDFYRGSTLLGSDTTYPYSFAWANIPAGSFALTAKATDSKGATTVSAVVNINVSNKTSSEKSNLAPTVSMTGPTSNARFIKGNNISITANAADSDGTITKVDFYRGDTKLGADMTSPYSFVWANIPAGSFALTAKATDSKGATTVSEVVNINVGEKASRSPYGGTAAIIPGTVEVENYDIGGQGVTYYDVDSGNNGGVYRTDDVDIEAASEGGYNVGWMNIDEWLEYTVNITRAGAYNFDARVASVDVGGTFHIECDGKDITGPLTIPATGGWDIWTSVKKSDVNLPSGIHVLRFVFESEGVNGYLGNLNSMHFTESNVTPTVSITGPAANAQFRQGDNISVTAKAADLDGSVVKVEFYNGTTLLGTDTTSPYSFAWANLPTGDFALIAKATNSQGVSTVSEVVNINAVEKANVVPEDPTAIRLLEGLVSFYEMNSNSSNILKDSHGKNHGVNTRINQVTGFIEKGNSYDGKSAISNVPHHPSLNLSGEFTLMADVYREGDGQSSTSIIVGKGNNNRYFQEYSLGITPKNKVRIRALLPGLTDWVSEATVPEGKWVRIIATYKSGKGYSLYMNGTKPESSPAFRGTVSKSGLQLFIGSNRNDGTGGAATDRRFEGKLDNVGIWNRELSQEEISDLIITKITYPDFMRNEAYRITMTTEMEELPGKLSFVTDSTKAKAGEKVIFMVEKEEEGVVFDHWSLNGETVTNQALFELEMPDKNITLTKHFRKFVAPEIKIVLPDQQFEFGAKDDIFIELETKSNDAEIEKVELFNGGDLIGKLTQDLSGVDWKNIPEGNHQLVATITDTNGKSYFSDPVVLKVGNFQSRDIPQVLLECVIGPNPTTDNLNVIFKNLDGNYDFEIRIVSMNGQVQKIFTVKPEESTVTLDVSDLKNGLYILHLRSNGNNLASKKFIKN